jgi:DNA-binding transcriptional LysR family regulator
MDLKAAQLRHFVNVASSGSYKEAARQGFRSQPAVSLALKTLETQIGAPLFENGRRVVLTGLGAAIFPLVEEYLQHHDRLARAIKRAARGEGGEILIASNPSVASHLLPTIIREYARRYPGVAVFATDDNSEKVYELVANGLVDLGLASLLPSKANTAFTPIFNDHFGVLCRSDHPFSKSGKSIDWALLRGTPIIGNVTHRLLEHHPVHKYLMEPHIFMSSLTSLLANVEGGIGVTVLPELASPTNHPRLVFKKLKNPVLTRTLGILVRSGRTLPPQAQALHDLIVQRFARRPSKVQ